ncbi:hypothetical protein BDW69DRAFT_182245 [Aspergillus filifer]
MPFNKDHGPINHPLSFPRHRGIYHKGPCSADKTVNSQTTPVLNPAAPQFIPAQSAPAPTQVEAFDHVQPYAGTTTGVWMTMAHSPSGCGYGCPTTSQPAPIGYDPPNIAPYYTDFVWHRGSTWDALLIREYRGNRPVRIIGGYPLCDPLTIGTFNPAPAPVCAPAPGRAPGHGQPYGSQAQSAVQIYSASFFILKTRHIFAHYGFTNLGIQALGRVLEWGPFRRHIQVPTVVVMMGMDPRDRRNIEFAVYDCLISFQVRWGLGNVAVEVVDGMFAGE